MTTETQATLNYLASKHNLSYNEMWNLVTRQLNSIDKSEGSLEEHLGGVCLPHRFALTGIFYNQDEELIGCGDTPDWTEETIRKCNLMFKTLILPKILSDLS